MALPIVKTALDCADYSKTVAPFLPQLTLLPSRIAASITDPVVLKQIYLDTNPLISALAFSLAIVPIFLIISEINKNYSQVDRMWSILPTMYNAHYTIYAHMLGLETKRLDTLVAASCLWSARLTFNYWRKGGYSIGSEDYRWEILRKYISPPLFFVFNVLFISLAQSVLLFSVTTPTYLILLASRIASPSGNPVPAWTSIDLVLSRLLGACVLLCFFADQQQWKFQGAKQSYQKTAKVPQKFNREDLDRGFVVTGLWSWSRHPNFVGEQAFWLVLYQWGCHATDSVVNWTALGALAYLILFQASTWFTELVSAKKYPEYREYQARVGKFLPRIGTDPKGDWKSAKEPQKSIDEPTAAVEKDAAHARERYNLR